MAAKMWHKLFTTKSKKNRTTPSTATTTNKKSTFSNVIKSLSLSTSKVNCSDADKKIAVLSDSDDGDIENVDNLDLEPCPICNRTFLPPALVKHVGICEKMNFKKRKPFDSFRQRREGTELANYLPLNYALPKQWSHGQPTIQSKSQTFTAGVTKKRPLLSQVNFERKIERSKSQQQPQDNCISTSTSTSSVISPTKPIKQRTTTLAPVSERCPHCDRSFGIKAFDRHVEWCKEKSRLKNPNSSMELSMAKERLEARTKYRAPNLKSKREKNREKYSGLSDSFTSLTESLSLEPYKRERKNSNMSVSLTSSITSDSKLSGRYDPFLSAKRQLEDLFSPSMEMATSTPIKATTTNNKTSNNNSHNLLSTSLNAKSPSNLSSTSTKSNFRRTSSLRAPKRTPPPTVYSTTKYKPTIQRGISDEGPISSNFMKPEEYDELPVKSHAIITPDLVPRSPSRDQIKHQRSPTRDTGRRSLSRSSSSRSPSRDIVIKRDPKSSAKRRNLYLDLKNPNAPGEYPLAKTDSLAAFLMYENDLSCSPPDDSNENISHNNNDLTLQLDMNNDLSDKNQQQQQQQQQQTSQNILNDLLLQSKIKYNQMNKTTEMQPDILQSPKYHSQGIKLSPIEKSIISAPSTQFRQNSSNSIDLQTNGQSIIEEPHSDIDPILINAQDNLKINLSRKLSDITSNDSCESNETTKYAAALNKSIENIVANQYTALQRINSGGSTISDITGLEKRSLKRQLKLNKDNFLYDNSADDVDNYNVIKKSQSIDDSGDTRIKSSILPPLQSISMLFETNEPITSKKDHRNADIESIFDDFDIEEFISSFEDDEQYPIFKNYKELLSNNRSNVIGPHEQQKDPSYDSDGESVPEEKLNEHETNNTINYAGNEQRLNREPKNISAASNGKVLSHTGNNETLTNDNEKPIKLSMLQNGSKRTTPERDCELPTTATRKISLPINDESISQAEMELLNSVHELNQMCESNSNFLLDSNDETSNADNFSLSRSLSSKLSGDSAYGSLCRQSPIEKTSYNPLQRTNQRNRLNQQLNYQIPEIIGSHTSNAATSAGLLSHMPTKTLLSPSVRLDSLKNRSGFESTLPPIIMHKNDSQNIYNAIHENSLHLSEINKNERSTTAKPTTTASAIISNNNNNKYNSNKTINNELNINMEKKDEAKSIIDSRMPRFCYECGAKYIVAQAKFCMECGVKRVSLDKNKN